MSQVLATPNLAQGETYNARVVQVRRVHEGLLILRIEPDGGRPGFQPGQYTVLGLRASEPRIDGVPSEGNTTAGRENGLIRRAYSIACPLLDEKNRLVTCDAVAYLEFYVTLVTRPSDDPPMLTPRLFALKEGDRIYLGPHPHGRYTLDPVRPHDDVFFLATGTGEAPHNAMIAELLAANHSGRVVCATCVRYRRDLAYLSQHRELERQFPRYHYVPLTTREPENLDSSRLDYIGKRYIQDFIRSRELRNMLCGRFDPAHARAFVCGNPEMIGIPQRGRDGKLVFPQPPGALETLMELGFRLDEPEQPGTIHFEKYW